MSKFRVKYGRSQGKSTNPLFKPNNFRFYINEAPGTSLTYLQMSKKDATAKAFKDAPECTFRVVQF